MKKTLFKSVLLGAAALVALNAQAENKLFIEDFEIAPGETKTVTLKVQHPDQIFSSLQAYFAPVEGLTFGDVYEPELLDEDDTYPTNARGRKMVVIPAYNFDDVANQFKIVLANMANGGDSYNGNALVAYWSTGTSYLADIEITASADFKGAQIVCDYCKASYDDPQAPASYIGHFELENVVVCNVTTPANGTPLADIVATGVNDQEYTVADALKIVSRAPKAGCVFVSDGKGNWMKVAAEGEVYDAIAAMDCIAANSLTGVLSDAECNQTLTVTAAPKAATDPVVAAATAWNLAQSDPTSAQYHFAPKVNEVILLTGYYFASEGAFRGYSSGHKGQSATVDMNWCNTETDMADGALYKDVECAVQLKEAWEAETPAGAPAHVKASDDLAFQNYIVYPLSIDATQILTGVENLNASKDVVSVKYVNAAGMVSNTPFQGVNMVVTSYADGSQVTTKVVK